MNKAQIVAWLFLTAVCVGGVWRVGKPSDQREQDQRQALNSDLRKQVQAKRRKPEWQKRVEAYWRLGEAKRAKQM